MEVSKLARMMLASLLVLYLVLVAIPAAEPASGMVAAFAFIVPGGQPSLAAGEIVYVDADAAGVQDGTSWENAYTTLQPALEDAAEGEEIWVAEGTYTPTHLFSPGDPRSATFQLKNGVALYGGFDPTVGDTGWEDRDWVNNETILSGDIGIAGDRDDNSYHVFYHPPALALDGSAILDGFTVTGGNANTGEYSRGGGMHNSNSSPVVTNCTFSSNSAYFDGGTVLAGSGGGMYNGNSSPVVTNCTFSGNSAFLFGGGMANYDSSPVVTNCTFSGNSTYWGGGMHNSDSSPVVTNCTFSGNSAREGGGLANRSYSSPSSPVVTNCILWGDSPDEMSGGSPVVTYSDIEGGHDGEGNIAVDPLFVNPASVDYHLAPGSSCIDAGTNNAPGLPAYDFEGDPRAMDGNGDWTAVVDIGVDEVLGVPPDVIYVDQDATGGNDGTSWEDAYTDLQPALDDAAGADGIWVAEGTYTPTHLFSVGDPRSATFQLRNGVALYGGFDPTVGDVGWDDRDWANNITILSGDIGSDGDPADNSYHVFYHPSELALDSSAILDGFMVTGGNANGDSANHDVGGGMYNYGSSPMLTNCTFSGSSAHHGGAMFNDYSSPTLIDCSFTDNSAAAYGGGMLNINGSTPRLVNCVVSANSAIDGGGMYNDWSSPKLTNCAISGNSAHDGGGMYNLHSSPVLANCTLAGNLASALGGGMVNSDGSSPTLTNCTFSGNSASNSGGGMFSDYDSSPVLTNSILWGDTPDEIYAIASSPVVTYSDIQGGYDGIGNIDADPLFADSSGGDYHLSPSSSCIDGGTNHSPNLPDSDFEGDLRIMDGNIDGSAVVDMGIDEVWGPPLNVIYVDQDAAGYNNGTSWEDALTDLQHALALAVDGVEIWVAEGTYRPTYLSSPGDPRSATFQLKNGVALYGGFDPSVGDAGWDGRDWVNNATILSGDIGILGEPGDNSYHVFYHPAELALDDSAVLDGFTLTGANANGSNPHDRGGGMHNYRASPSVINCVFSGNSADSYGGGMANFYSSPAVSYCTYSGNSAQSGGGMSNRSSSSPAVTKSTFSGNSASSGGGMVNLDSSSPTVTSCAFLDNTATFSGGGMDFSLSRSVVTNCAFLGNSAGERGGGMSTNASSALAVINCIFTGNSATYRGGGIYNVYSSPSVINCTFWGNTASSGGGMSNHESSSPVTNCILWGDSMPEIYNFGDREPVVTYTDVQGGYIGEGNIDVAPLFVDAGSGDFHLSPGSPCIDAGDNDASDLPDHDFEGDDRILDGDSDGMGIVDLGADEALWRRVYLPVVLRMY